MHAKCPRDIKIVWARKGDEYVDKSWVQYDEGDHVEIRQILLQFFWALNTALILCFQTKSTWAYMLLSFWCQVKLALFFQSHPKHIHPELGPMVLFPGACP